MSEQQQAQFNGWAKVEVMGHQTHIGYVRTEAYGKPSCSESTSRSFRPGQYTLDKPRLCRRRNGRQQARKWSAPQSLDAPLW